ncbi:MAG: hypothetical protein DCC55_30085 [Chloroflexi bacterium]|nr:MAG: hypothetical protein DCC55_30085 [Chloroflexota bacterium]
MQIRCNQVVCLFALVTALAFLSAACSGEAGSLAAFLTPEGRQPEPTQTLAPTLEGEPAAPAAGTAQAALQAAVEALQGTPTEETVAAAGGRFPATPTAPLLTEGPSVTVTPGSGRANAWVTVTGSGFPANVRVDVYLAGLVSASALAAAPRSYATTFTDRDGNYSMSFAMPSTWPDGTPIETGTLAVLVATEDFGFRANTSFDFVAETATPTQVPPATLTLTPNPTATPVPTAMPTAPRPTAIPPPAVNPYAEVTPLSGGRNAQVTLRGGGFPGHSVIHVYLGTFDAQVGGGERVRYGSAVTESNGNFTISFTLPATWPDGTPVAPGRLLILVATEDLSRQASAVFDYVVPTPTPALNPYAEVQPPSGSANTQVTIRGGGFPANTRVHLYLAGLVSVSAAEAAPTSYASTTTDSAGNYSLTFVMPRTWPDGEAIESGTLALLVATEDFRVRANATFDFVAPTPTAVSGQSWQGSYYANPDLRGDPVLVRADAEIHFYWGTGSPDPALPNDEFSVRWQRSLWFESGLYRFTVEVDDGVRLFVDGNLLLESWRRGERRVLSLDYPMQAGQHTVQLDYFEHAGDALIILNWHRLSDLAPPPTGTPGAPGLLFSNHPWNNQRGVNQTFCSGFESECNYAGCVRNYRLVWGPYCREGDYPYIRPGLYRVTFYGIGRVRAGATDYGSSRQLFSFGQHEFELPGSFTFCWPGRQSDGYGFETIAQSTGVYAAIDWITVEYLGEQCR